MSLRVLLADESASIKKVFQLGLQDYAAEVKTVQSGVDVIEVAEQFSPDIIFADILLQKQNGYDVCEAVKQHETLAKIPFVLMWSSFMELDQGRFQECHADGEIEKPFDVELLREHIRNLVAKAGEQQISSFLDFPTSINQDFIDEENERAANPPEMAQDARSVINLGPAPEEEDEENSSVFNQPDFTLSSDDEDEGLAEPPLVSQTEPTQQMEAQDFSSWEVKPDIDQEIQRNALEVPMELNSADEWQSTQFTDEEAAAPTIGNDDNFDNFSAVSLDRVPEETDDDGKLDINEFLYKPGEDDTPQVSAQPIPVADVRIRDMDEEDGIVEEQVMVTASQVKKAVLEALPMDDIEAIVRAHTQELIKMNIVEQLPQIIEKIAREELDKLLKEELATKTSLG